jgi:hypothetical protein
VSGVNVGFVSIPPEAASAATNYTLTIDIIDRSSSLRMPNASGTISVTMLNASGTQVAWLFGSTTATTQSLTVASGRVTGTMQIPTAAGAGTYRLVVASGTLTNAGAFTGATSVTFQVGGSAGGALSLKFSTQPSSAVSLGSTFSCAVTVIDGAGTTQTTATNTVTLALESMVGGTPSSGIASFTNQGCTLPGQYRLRATSPGLRDATSTPFIVSGTPVPGDIVGLRQNCQRDGTLYVGTTGYPTVTANPSISTTEKGRFDSDLTSATGKTVHGVRLVFPYPIALEKLETKFKVSSLTGTPVIRVLYSQDTTTGTDGTWTLLSSYTPVSTSVSLRTFQLTERVYCKGVWVTIDQGSGSASCIWYAIHPFGGYIGAPISYLNTSALPVDSEGVLSIPYPSVPINAATTKVRDVQMRNNTGTDYILSLNVEPAREGVDAAVDDEVTLVSTDSTPFPVQFLLPAYGSKNFRLRYTSTSAPASLDGDHLVRFSVRNFDEDVSQGVFADYVAFGAVTSVGQWTLNGTLVDSQASSNIQQMSAFMVPGSILNRHGVGYNVTATNLIRFLAILNTTTVSMDVTSVTTETEWTRILPLTTYTGLVSRESSANIYMYDVNEADMTQAAWLATSGRTKITLPSTVSGAKTIMPGAADRIWISNGRSSSAKIYEYDLSYSLRTTIDCSTNLAGLTIDCHCYDPISDEIYVVTRPSGGSRKIARYSAVDGSFITSVTNSDEGGTGNADGCSVLGQYLYVFYNARYLNRYDRTTLANNVRKYDHGASNDIYADPNWRGLV